MIVAECFSHKEVQFKQFCLPVKTSYPPAENVNETLAFFLLDAIHFFSVLELRIWWYIKTEVMDPSDYFLYSHHLSACHYTPITGRNWMLISHEGECHRGLIGHVLKLGTQNT